MTELTCPYCNEPAILVTGRQIYPNRTDLHAKHFWQCPPCGAYVGCHPNTTNPLGRLANASLRKAKMAAHAAFDPIWQSGDMSRSDAYEWLSHALSVVSTNCHIGMFDVDMCKLVVSVCEERCKPPMPLPQENINWDSVIRSCQERLAEYTKGTETDSDIPHYIYETAMSAVFGSNVWTWMSDTVKARTDSIPKV